MGLSTCAKACIGCGICTAVVLAVMIPVTMLVIVPSVAPGMGQKALDASTMNIPRSTTLAYYDVSSCLSCTRIINEVVLYQNSLPLSAKLAGTDVVMHIPNGSGIFPYPEQDLGWFHMPEQIVKHGSNSFDFESNFTIFDALTFINFGMSFIDPRWQVIKIAARPTMTVLWGITFELKLGKELNCTFYDSWPVTPGVTTTTAKPDPTVGTIIRLSCEQLGNLAEDETDALLAKFHNETTTTPGPMTPAPMTPTIETV